MAGEWQNAKSVGTVSFFPSMTRSSFSIGRVVANGVVFFGS